MIHEDQINPNCEPPEGDGFIFNNQSKSHFAIVTADCLPLYLKGKDQSALIHAGWRGVYNQIVLQDKILKMGIDFVHIGPHIKQCCFEVTQEFKDYFPNKNYFSRKSEKLYFSLEKAMTDQLKQVSNDIQIEISSICTCCHEDFHSFRRSKTKKRNWNIISTICSDNI